jgi:hypothetical protein
MKKVSGLHIVLTFLLVFYFVAAAEAATVSFQNFAAGSGVTVGVPYRANAGTERDPDTVTLVIDLSVSRLEFELTVEGTGFTSGSWCELDWDDEKPGSPREQNVRLSGSGFRVLQNFSFSPVRLNLADGGTRVILYELDVDEEPIDSRWDTERHLRITFVASGSNPAAPSKPSAPSTPPNPSQPSHPSTPSDTPSNSGGNDSGSGGCNTTLTGFAALGLFAFVLRRSLAVSPTEKYR